MNGPIRFHIVLLVVSIGSFVISVGLLPDYWLPQDLSVFSAGYNVGVLIKLYEQRKRSASWVS